MAPLFEDYLKTISYLEELHGKARITDIADRLSVTKSTVCITMKRLKKMGLIRQETYGPVRLTAIGRKRAAEIRSRYTLLKDFLMQILGVGDCISEREACQIEHIVSPQTMEKIGILLKKRNG